MKPLVSIIAICYNHSGFLAEALKSLFNQTYEEIEVIIIDDASKDDSVEKIEKLLFDNECQFVKHANNKGYTKTFNEGLGLAKGDYVVDFSLDDIMLPDFILSSVKALSVANKDVGLVFSNAEYIDTTGKVIANHNETLFKKKMLDSIPSGDVFQAVLRRYFICTPTMVMKKEMLVRLGGYDEGLAYEDFDLWVRASRYWQFEFIDEVTFQKRKLASSMSSQRHLHHYNEQMSSTYAVCVKAFHLCKSKKDFAAYYERINYEYRQCVKFGAEELVDQYLKLLREAGGKLTWKSDMYRLYKRQFRVLKS